jgi:alpha-D-xyloside xylohydrolase
VQYSVRHAFDNDLAVITPDKPNEFPDNQYAANPELPFSLDFVSPRTLRIRMSSGPQAHPPHPGLMLAGEVPRGDSWKYEKVPGGWRYASAFGSVTIRESPFHFELHGAISELLTATDHAQDNKSTFSLVLPHIALAHSTAQMDWSKIELAVFAKDTATAKGLVFLPGETQAHELTLTKSGDSFKLDADPLAGKVAWKISVGKIQ